MSANQLIAKALSTASEDEAIACLRMARKKGMNIEGTAKASAVEAARFDEAREWEWVQLVAKTRSERDKYKRMLREQLDVTQQLKKQLIDANFKIGMTVILVATVVSMFWLLVGTFV